MTAQVDPTGTGQNFVAMTITQNGVPCSNSRTLSALGLAWSCNKEVLLPPPPPQLLLLLEVNAIYCKD